MKTGKKATKSKLAKRGERRVRRAKKRVMVRGKKMAAHHTRYHAKVTGVAVRSAADESAKEALVSMALQTRQVLSGELLFDYVSKNVGSRANDILSALVDGPKKDEQVAETLNIKLNEARRMLNLLNNFGIVRYDVNRDSTGWLTFVWRVDHGAVIDFEKSVGERSSGEGALPEGCNDFFVCGTCYKKQKMIYPFDMAYENGFKCNCGRSLEMLTRSQAEEVVKS